jgi:trk system potassium uptake protein TrkA
VVEEIMWPRDVALVTILREGHVLQPAPDRALEAGDELLFVSAAEREPEIAALLSPHGHVVA